MEKKMDQLFDAFIRHARSEGKSHVTIKNYRDNFELLKKFKPEITVEDLTPSTMADFFCYLQDRERKVGNNETVVRDLKNSSLATVRAKLKAFFTWLIDNGYPGLKPFKGIKWPEVEYTDKRAFTKEELDKICLAVSRDIKWQNHLLKKRNIAMVMTFALTGIRRAELLGQKISDFDFKNKVLTVRGEISKSKRTKLIPINPELIPYLEDYLEERKDYTTEFMWVSNNRDRNFTEHGLKHLKNHLDRVAGLNCHVHRFRHTFAVNYYKIGGDHDILGLLGLLGHKTIRTTAKYLRSLTNDNTVEQIYRMTLAKYN